MEIMLQWMKDHSLMLLLLAGTIFTCLWMWQMRKTMEIHWYHVFLFSVLHTAAGVLCVTGFAFMESGFDPDSAGNMSLFGAVFFMPLFYLAASKLMRVKLAQMFDAGTICMVFTLMCARINCLITGCCFGNQIGGTSIRWPTREAEILFYIILLAAVAKKVKAGRTGGEVYPVYMISYGVFRFITEWFRYSGTGSMVHLGHIWAVISLFLGFSIYTERKRKGRRVKI